MEGAKLFGSKGSFVGDDDIRQLLNQHHVKDFLENAWNKDLPEELLAEGLLTNLQRNLTKNEACTAVVDNIQHKDQVIALCRALETCGFSGMAKSLIMDNDVFDDMDTIDHISAAGSNYSTPRPQSTSALRSSLRRSENRARQWEQRARELEATQDLMAQWLKQSNQNENQIAVEVGLLREKEVLLESKLMQRSSGLKLWKLQEKHRTKEVDQFEKRIEELTRVLRSRDADLDQMKVQRNEFEQKINSLKVQASNKRKGLAEIPEHRLTLLHQQSNARVGVKLPTLVHAIEKYGSTESVSGISATEKLPSVDAAGNVVARKKSKKSQAMFASNGEAGFKHLKQLMAHETWVSQEGQHFDLPNVSVTFPPNAFQSSTYVSVLEYPKDPEILNGLKATGLNRYLELCVTVGIQPYNAKVFRSLLIEVKNAHAFSQGRILVCSRMVDYRKDTEWTEALDGALAKLSGDCALFHVRHLGLYATFRILVPSADPNPGLFYANGMGLRPHLSQSDIKYQAMAILNGHHAPCTFHIFINRQEKCFIVVCDFPSKGDNLEPPEHLEELENLPYVGFHQVAVNLCAGEMIYPYFNGQPLPGEEFAMELTSLDDSSDCIQQIIDVSYENAPHQLERPTVHSFELKRKVANSETVQLCEFDVPQMIGKLTTNPFHRHLTPQEVITKFHGKLEKIVDVRYLMETLKKQHVFSGDEAFYICQGNTREARVKSCLNLLMNKGDHVIKLFVQSLTEEYDSLAGEMLKHFETEYK